MTASLGEPPGSAFRQTADGPELDLGTYRFLRPWLAGIAVFAAAAVVFYFSTSFVLSTLGPVTLPILLAFASPVIMFVAFAVGMGIAVALRVGTWSIRLSESGIRVVRGRRPPREIPWGRIARIRWGPVAVKVSRYRTDLAEGLHIEVRGRGTRRFDTARFRVRAADLDLMAAAIREAAGRHAVPVEPFPMMGRERY